MSKYVGNLIPHTFFVTKGSGESDLELHAGSYHMALHDAGISDFNIMVYSSVLPATAHIASMDEIDLPPFGSELKTILAVSHGQQDEFVSAGVVYAWMSQRPLPHRGARSSSDPCDQRPAPEDLWSLLPRRTELCHRRDHDREALWYGSGWSVLHRLPAARGRARRASLLSDLSLSPATSR